MEKKWICAVLAVCLCSRLSLSARAGEETDELVPPDMGDKIDAIARELFSIGQEKGEEDPATV